VIRKASTFVLTFGFLAAFLAANQACATKGNSLQIKGSDTMVNLVQSWAEEFMAKNPATFIAVTGGGSGTGLAALINGTCDLAMSSREIKEKERELALGKGIEPLEFKVALDGLAVVVHQKNPVSQITMEELTGIFTGKITNWKEIGGEDAKIVLLSREVNSGTHLYFKEYVLRNGDTASKEEFSPEALLLPSSQAIADEVLQNPAAIGYYGMGYIGKGHKALSIAKEKNASYVYPTIENVVSGAYPISRPLFIYTNREPKGDLKQFTDYILSGEGQAIVSQQDFVPIK